MPTIGLALALWALRNQDAARIRRLLSPFRILGASVIGWPQLRRWARAYGFGDGTLRERAERFAQEGLARSPLSAQTHGIQARIFASFLQPV
ncbi:MAG: hypothetical protein GY913_16605 [Proteobacteria bacterium]|nr:hypothetical protein [Pseudomonadota bacterium]